MAPSSPSTTSSATLSESKPSSAIHTALGKKAASKTLTEGSAASCPERSIYSTSAKPISRQSLIATTTHPENVSPSKPQLSYLPSTCCTSNVNPPSRLRGNDGYLVEI